MDLTLIDGLVDFMRGRGYVLDFSDVTFADFFAAELDVDINDPIYAKNGGSKGKRLRSFLQQEDNATARLLQAVWERRVQLLLQSGINDPIKNAEGQLNRAGFAGGSEP